METKKFTYYQDEDMYIGWLVEFPDYKTRGTLYELKDNMKGIHKEFPPRSGVTLMDGDLKGKLGTGGRALSR